MVHQRSAGQVRRDEKRSAVLGPRVHQLPELAGSGCGPLSLAHVVEEQGGDQFEIVAPSLSILAEPPVAVVDKNVDKKGTREVATAYLQYLYSEEGQRIAAKNFYRPRDEKVAAEFAKQFPQLKLVTIDKDFGGWKSAQPKFFNDGGVFDQIYQAQ